MLFQSTVECKDVFFPTSRQLASTRRLYESTHCIAERIPWNWLERSVRGKASDESNSWNKHLILATPSNDPNTVAGYLFGTYIPGFAGYVSYMGVDDRFRGQGIGTMLYRKAFAVFHRDAELVDEMLPFVLWESRPPEGEREGGVWSARAHLFDKLGAFWVDGLDFWAPNYEMDFEPLPYQLFIKPMMVRKEAFTPGRIRRVAHDQYRRTYKLRPGDEFYNKTLADRPRARLRPARMAERMLELV